MIVDTFAKMFASLDDENDNSAVSRLMRTLDTFAKRYGLTVLIVHHYGKAQGAGLRGASALLANASFVLSVTGGRDQQTGNIDPRFVQLSKVKEAETGQPVPFDIRTMILGRTEAGEEVTAGYAVRGADAGRKMGKGPGKVVRVLGEAGPMQRATLRDKLLDQYGVARRTAYAWIDEASGAGDIVADGAGGLSVRAWGSASSFSPVADEIAAAA